MKAIAKVSGAHEIVLDSELLQCAHLKVGDEVNVELSANGGFTITPVVSREVKETMDPYVKTLKNLK